MSVSLYLLLFFWLTYFVDVAFLQQVVWVLFFPLSSRSMESGEGKKKSKTGDRSAAFFIFTHGFNTGIEGGMDFYCAAHATPRIAQASRKTHGRPAGSAVSIPVSILHLTPTPRKNTATPKHHTKEKIPYVYFLNPSSFAFEDRERESMFSDNDQGVTYRCLSHKQDCFWLLLVHPQLCISAVTDRLVGHIRAPPA